MQKEIRLRLLPAAAADENAIRKQIAEASGMLPEDISGFTIQKKSIDARSRQAWVNLTVQAFIHEPFRERSVTPFNFKEVSHAKKKVIIIGAGPAGLFAALQLLETGIQPVILERGKDVRSRRRDLAILNREGIINPESNYCFGEGGAGTYSDGKLYTRSSKRGNINRILELFFHFGADESILYESHPHIGTNKLPGIITAIRKKIIECGGAFHFEKKVTGFNIERKTISGVITADGDRFTADAVILATGHSARDIFTLLQEHRVTIEAKPFALGVRVEHPQSIIDSIQYHCRVRDALLPPAPYSLVQQVDNRGVFSFCMCPGGIIAPAATSENELVVNGWSPSKRNNAFANSGIVVEIDHQDLKALKDFEKITGRKKEDLHAPLGMMYFQQYVERKAFDAGGGKFVAPAQRMEDFCRQRVSTSLPSCSYLPGIEAANLQEVLPPFVFTTLQKGFRAFGKKMPGYLTNEALIVATESRTSSPVRIPRDPLTLQHPEIQQLYPCGEGAGYAGGIVSAAMDGERIAGMIAKKLLS
ncbi:MAG: FAD-binding protein [Terrimonas sp.]|nr:FAD-binding protein [Terrimonas sp.]